MGTLVAAVPASNKDCERASPLFLVASLGFPVSSAYLFKYCNHPTHKQIITVTQTLRHKVVVELTCGCVRKFIALRNIIVLFSVH